LGVKARGGGGGLEGRRRGIESTPQDGWINLVLGLITVAVAMLGRGV
jgi:hypothetical protein